MEVRLNKSQELNLMAGDNFSSGSIMMAIHDYP
jgi:hypothetical protein